MKTRNGSWPLEDRGDRVEGEQQVRRPDREHDDQHRRDHAPAVDADERARPVELRGDRQHPPHVPQRRVLLELLVVLGALPRQVHRRDDEHHGEQVEHPAERVDGRGPDGDERTAHHQRDHDADQQHPVLVLGRDLERRHDDDEDEQVVHRQRVLGDVAGEELAGRHRAGEHPQPDAEGHSERHVEQHPPGGLARRHRVRLVVDEEQVRKDDRRQTTDGGQPEPQGHVHAVSFRRRSFGRRRAARGLSRRRGQKVQRTRGRPVTPGTSLRSGGYRADDATASGIPLRCPHIVTEGQRRCHRWVGEGDAVHRPGPSQPAAPRPTENRLRLPRNCRCPALTSRP